MEVIDILDKISCEETSFKGRRVWGSWGVSFQVQYSAVVRSLGSGVRLEPGLDYF